MNYRMPPATGAYIGTMPLHGSDRALRLADTPAPSMDRVRRHNEKLRRRYWQQLVGHVARPRALPPLPIAGACARFAVGPLIVAEARIGASGFVRDADLALGGLFRSHLLVLLPQRGGIHGTVDGRIVELRQGDIAFFDLAHEADVDAADGTYLALLVPRESVHGGTGGLVLRESQLPCRMLARHLEQLLVSAPAAGGADAEALARSTEAVVQLCVDFAPAAPRQGAQALRSRILAYIDEHLDEPELTPELIARTFHISRTWLYRIFSGAGGIRRCIRDKRLDAAFRDLCEDPRRRVIDVAWHRGFASERHFQRAFNERFGLNPSEVRSRSRQGLPIEAPAP